MKTVVVIGGGFVGAHVSRNLEKNFKVILIDTKDYFEFTPAILRTIVEPEHIKKVQILHNHYLKKAKVILEHVKEITDKEVIINNKRITFDYLVIGSGSSYGLPIKEEDIVIATRASHLRHSHEDLEKAKTVLIIGGGLVGVELAAEIICHYKNKNITIIHSKDRLIERNKISASTYTEKFLKERGVKILFNEKFIKKVKKEYITDKGTKIKADIVFLCTGIKPNFQLLKNNFKESLNERNQIRVNSYLQAENSKNIFAGGDIVNIQEEKTAQNAEHHAKIIVKNINAIENKESLEEYKVQARPMIISLGKWCGIFIYKNLMFKGILPGILKNIVEFKEMMKFKF